ncbi:POK10 protein, partial [Fregata magnificens]|nr:POK10 protein [Fregata magnificens]
LQRLLGTINWVRPLLRITTQDLTPLFDLLKGNPLLTSQRSITLEGQKALEKVTKALEARQCHHIVTNEPIRLTIINNAFQPYGLLCQQLSSRPDPLVIL